MKSGVQIECLIKRKGGTRVDFDAWPNENLPEAPTAPAAQYHFVPLDKDDPDSPHVATITNEHHRDRLLSIGHGYRLHGSPDFADVLSRPAAPKVADPLANAGKPPPPANPQSTKTSDVPDADPEVVIEICNLSVRELKNKVSKYRDIDLRGALAREEKSGDKPRAQWREIIQSALSPVA